MSLYNYFKIFITDDLLKHISDRTNIYAMQADEKELGVTSHSIEQFIGILLFSGTYPCPSYRMYWQSASRFPANADGILRNKI